MVKKMKIASV